MHPFWIISALRSLISRLKTSTASTYLAQKKALSSRLQVDCAEVGLFAAGRGVPCGQTPSHQVKIPVPPLVFATNLSLTAVQTPFILGQGSTGGLLVPSFSAQFLSLSIREPFKLTSLSSPLEGFWRPEHSHFCVASFWKTSNLPLHPASPATCASSRTECCLLSSSLSCCASASSMA